MLWEGWWCYECGNEWAWMDVEHQALVFSPHATIIDTSYIEGRIRLNRYIDWCILCHDTRGSILDRADYKWYVCSACTNMLRANIWHWLTDDTELNLPEVVATRIFDFVSFPD